MAGVVMQPSAEMPVLDGRRVEMLEALDNKQAPFFALARMLPSLREDLVASAQHMSLQGTMEDLGKDRERNYVMAKLLHAIPKDLLRSIIRGTLSYDMRSSLAEADKPKRYGAGHFGTYVASMSIEGRDGKFLSQREMSKLKSHVEEYLEGFESWAVSGRWDMTSPVARALRHHVLDVDQQYGSYKTDERPRFVNRGNFDVMRLLPEMLDKRIVGAVNADVLQKQSPLMTGCTADTFGKRCRAHYPDDASKLSSTTPSWALVCCVLRKMGLRVKVDVVPVLCTFERGQLPLSERLVTSLTQSLITQDGFNICQGGGRSDSSISASRFGDAKFYMAVAMPVLRDNLEESALGLEAVQGLISKAEEVSGVLDKAKDMADRTGRLERSLIDLHMKYIDFRAEFREATAEMEKAEERRAQLEAENERLDGLLQVMSRFFGIPVPDFDEGEDADEDEDEDEDEHDGNEGSGGDWEDMEED